MDWSVDRSLGVGGVVFATVLLVLDKAGKLKGPLLLILLAIALCMLIPILFSIPWVAHASPGSQVWARRLFMTFLVGVLWASLSVWVTSGIPNKDSEPVEHLSSQITVKELDLLLIPHGNNSPLLCLEVKNKGDDAKIAATIRVISRSYGGPVDTRPYAGRWTLLSYKRRFGDHRATPTATAVTIPSGDHRILEIARQHPENGRGNDISEAKLVGFGEFLRWDFEPKVDSKLPTFRLDIEFRGEGIPKTISKLYDVGPVAACGPLGMTEVTA
jgi:hypothetical protein